MTDNPQIIYIHGNPNQFNRSHRKAFGKEIDKIKRLKTIDIAFEEALFSDFEELTFPLLLGFYNQEYLKECEKCEKFVRGGFSYFKINKNYMIEKYSNNTIVYENDWSIINLINNYISKVSKWK